MYRDILGDTITYYDMNGTSLGTINNEGRMTYAKINSDDYNYYVNGIAEYNGVDLTDQSQANAFVKGLNSYAQAQEDLFGQDRFSAMTGLSLSYTGTTEQSNTLISQYSINNGSAKSQYTEGSLAMSITFDNNSSIQLGTWTARSGPWGNSSIPNGDYSVTGIQNTSQSGMVLNGIGYKAFITDNVALNRTALRIHPDQSQNGSAGCIGLDCSAADLSSFRLHLQRYFGNNQNGNIPLNVNVPNNPNYDGNGTTTFTGGE